MPLFTRRRLLAGFAAIGAVAGVFGLRSAVGALLRRPGLGSFRRHALLRSAWRRRRRASPTLLRWYGGRQKAEWPAWAPSPYSDRPPARVDGPDWRISYVGHASLLLQTAGLNILIDPVWSERVSPVSFAGPKRVNDPGIAFEALPPIDVVLVSHCHYDHLDVETLSRLAAAHRPRVVTPLGNDTIMKDHDPAIRAEAYDWHDRVELGDGRRRHAGADAALVGARADRPQQGAVGLVRDRDAGRAASIMWRIQATATAIISAPRATAMGRSASRSCRSAPTSRAGSWATST